MCFKMEVSEGTSGNKGGGSMDVNDSNYVCMYHGSSRFKYYIPWCSAAAEQKKRCLKNETHDTWIVECVLSVHP